MDKNDVAVTGEKFQYEFEGKKGSFHILTLPITSEFPFLEYNYHTDKHMKEAFRSSNSIEVNTSLVDILSASYRLEHLGRSNNHQYQIFGSHFGSITSSWVKSSAQERNFPGEVEDGLIHNQVYINADGYMYRNLMHRSMHWIYLLYIVILYCRYHFKKWLRKLHDNIKDDKYLVDMELNNVP